jgi:uncharacterized protein (TIGR02391 family)
VSAQERQNLLLRRIVAADNKASDTFFTASSFDGTTLFHEGFEEPGHQVEVGIGDIKALAVQGLLALTETRDFGDIAFVVTPAGRARTARVKAGSNEKQSSHLAPPKANKGAIRRVLQLSFDIWNRTGEWPRVSDLQRDAERRREDIDVEEVARQLPHAIGWIDNSGERRVILRIQGLENLDGTHEYLDAFLKVVRLLYDRYVGDADKARVTDEDLRRLGFDQDMVTRLYSIVENEWFLFGSGGGVTGGAWYREPSPQIRMFRSVSTIQDYLQVIEELSSSRPTNLAQPIDLGVAPPKVDLRPTITEEPATEVAEAIPGLELLNPVVLSASASLYRTGHFAEASFAALKSVEYRVRQISGLTGTGHGLMGKAFNPDNPVITIPTLVEEMAADERQGVLHLFMGAMFFRNVGGHGFPIFERRLAADHLVFASMLHDCLDTATQAAPSVPVAAPSAAIDSAALREAPGGLAAPGPVATDVHSAENTVQALPEPNSDGASRVRDVGDL